MCDERGPDKKHGKFERDPDKKRGKFAIADVVTVAEADLELVECKTRVRYWNGKIISSRSLLTHTHKDYASKRANFSSK